MTKKLHRGATDAEIRAMLRSLKVGEGLSCDDELTYQRAARIAANFSDADDTANDNPRNH
jgi:hypothetical protein